MSAKRSESATKRSSLARMIDQGTMLLMVSIGALIIILAMLILFHQNANATKGYLLRSLEKERSRLLLEEEVLKMEFAQEQSLSQIESDPVVKSMFEYSKVQYIEEQK